MSRMPNLDPQAAGWRVKLARMLTRRLLRRMTGRAVEPSMLDPLEVYAHAPTLMIGYGRMEQATGKITDLAPRHRHLAELKAATMTACEYCIDIGSQVARLSGLTDDELLALPSYRDSPLFDEVDRLVLDYSVGMSVTPVAVDDRIVARLRERFTDKQVVELTHVIAIENHRGRFNSAMGIGAAGFTQGMVCAVPVTGNRPVS